MLIERVITVIDSHTAGEPTRIITGGLPPIKGKTMVEKRNYFEDNFDYIRTMVMREPRGHRDMFGAALVEPVHESCDLGVIFLSTGNSPQAYPYMCGHGTIGLISAAIETGMIPKREPVTQVAVDTPDGIVVGRARLENGEVMEVEFDSVPAFLYKADLEVDVPGIGMVKVDIAFSGGFFVMASAKDFGVSILPQNASQLSNLGLRLRDAVNRSFQVDLPEKPYFKTVDVVELSEAPNGQCPHYKNVVILGDGQVDRSPCGTGTSAKMAVLFSKGKLKKGEEFTHQSITGTIFKGRIKDTFEKEGFNQVINSISSPAYITGFNQLIATKNDPLKDGFNLA